jgi:hypothetical protein
VIANQKPEIWGKATLPLGSLRPDTRPLLCGLALLSLTDGESQRERRDGELRDGADVAGRQAPG